MSNKGKLIDETGNRYGRLTVIKYVKNPKRGAYWLCKCDCGNETVVGAYHLRAGTTRSCGCIVQENGRKYIRDIAGANALPPEEAAFRRLLNNYKQSARRRGLKFAISKEMFRALTKQRCHYCGQEPSRIYAGSEGRGEYFYNGIDRKDNERGYEEDNCVPCCATCNSNKGTKTYSEFVEYLDRIAAFRGSGKCT